MEYLQNLLDGSTVPVVTAFLLGLLTAISPCPLAANITAIGYIGPRHYRPQPDFPRRLAVCARPYRRLYPVGSGVDRRAARGCEYVRPAKSDQQIRRNAACPGSDPDRAVHAFRAQTQAAAVRVFGRRQNRETRRLGSVAAGRLVRDGILPHQRGFLLRDADSDVGGGNGRLSAACGVRARHGSARGGRRLDAGIQRGGPRTLFTAGCRRFRSGSTALSPCCSSQ